MSTEKQTIYISETHVSRETVIAECQEKNWPEKVIFETAEEFAEFMPQSYIDAYKAKGYTVFASAEEFDFVSKDGETFDRFYTGRSAGGAWANKGLGSITYEYEEEPFSFE